ncbi:30S ribosomal protein S3 [Candidatus Gracilibacteria bacterium]|nr:30S ribosomal protein S3 [Candidatus Gracilibacteria bacterium]MCF7898467.1 30S ribosomal protein S3 [Candidatus Paceibacterota bacterium]
MTHVVHPYSHRLGIIRGWKSRWFGKNTSQYVDQLRADVLVRAWMTKRLKGMYLSLIEIERTEKQYRVMIHTSRPGMIIGRGGDGIEKIRAGLKKEMARLKIFVPQDVKLDIIEVASPEADAAIVAAMITEGMEKRLPFRRVLKTTIEKVMANRDVLGARISVSGRLGGAEMARREQIKRGGIPLQTLRADIDFARERANMTYGVIGIKVWIYRGMKFDKKDNK